MRQKFSARRRAIRQSPSQRRCRTLMQLEVALKPATEITDPRIIRSACDALNFFAVDSQDQRWNRADACFVGSLSVLPDVQDLNLKTFCSKPTDRRLHDIATASARGRIDHDLSRKLTRRNRLHPRAVLKRCEHDVAATGGCHEKQPEEGESEFLRRHWFRPKIEMTTSNFGLHGFECHVFPSKSLSITRLVARWRSKAYQQACNESDSFLTHTVFLIRWSSNTSRTATKSGTRAISELWT